MNMIIVGDLHGQLLDFESMASSHKIVNATYVQVGDLGLGFKSTQQDLNELKRLDNYLKSTNCHMYAIRGNHDCKSFWDTRDKMSFENLHLVGDYDVFEIEGQKVLFIGGGISIDRLFRRVNVNYWENERFVLDQQALGRVSGVSTVVTHIAPKAFWPYEFNHIVHHFIRWEKSKGRDLVADLDEERTQMNEVLFKIRPQYWYYGHYHERKYQYHEKMNVRAYCVAMISMYNTETGQTFA